MPIDSTRPESLFQPAPQLVSMGIINIAKREENHMSPIQEDPERENRIVMEIIVDAYGPEEQAIAWYYYLQDELFFPFTATCIVERATSPLHMGNEVKML